MKHTSPRVLALVEERDGCTYARAYVQHCDGPELVSSTAVASDANLRRLVPILLREFQAHARRQAVKRSRAAKEDGHAGE